MLFDRKAPLRQHAQELRVMLRRPITADELIKKRAQPAFSDLFRVELPNGTGSGVAGIRESRLAGFLALVIRPLEFSARKIYLAADLYHALWPAVQYVRNIRDRSDI